jgi:serine/threonine protein kinase
MNTTGLIYLKSRKGSVFEIPQGPTAVGRPPIRGFAVPRGSVSRPHALFERQADTVWLTDLNSRNGTFVNGVRLRVGERRRLAGGDAIQFSKRMKPLVIVGDIGPGGPVDEAAIGTPGAGSLTSGTRDVFGFEPGVIEFAKLGMHQDAAAKLAARFRPVQVVATGGMGRVILAQDVLSGRFVAVKIMLREMSEQEAYVQQFIREAVITARLQHPHVVPVYDLGFFTDNQLYYTMRYIDGKRLDEVLGEMDLVARLRVLRAAALAVGYAHTLGLWHRDLKPQNILVGEFGDTYVIDWGLVSVQHGREYRLSLPKIMLNRKTIVLPDNLLEETRRALTTVPGFMGPPAYMAPEQLAGDEARMGAASDVWAFGVMLFEALTGQHPLEDYKGVPGQLMPSVLAERLPRPGEVAAGVPEELGDLCERMLVKDPGQRMPDLGEFVARVESFLLKHAEFVGRPNAAGTPKPYPRTGPEQGGGLDSGLQRRKATLFPSLPLLTPRVREDTEPPSS